MTKAIQFAISASVALLLSSTGWSQYFGGQLGSESRTTVRINPDGSSACTNELVQSRALLEQQVKSWSRYSNMDDADGQDPGSGTAAAAQEKKNDKPLTNEELAKKLQEMQNRSDSEEGLTIKVEDVSGSTNLIRMISTRAFPTLKDLVADRSYSWAPRLFLAGESRIEIDTNKNFRLTFKTVAANARYAKAIRRSWTASKAIMEWKIMMPGKVLSSSLSGVEGNATWMTVNTTNNQSIDAALALSSTNIVIVSEAGNIKLSEPLESATLARSVPGRGGKTPELPITDAGPGYTAEPMGITVTTVYNFPQAGKDANDAPEASRFGGEDPGTLIWAKLFAPKGREIRSISAVKAKSAKDDTGASVISTNAVDGNEDSSYTEYSSSSSSDSAADTGTSFGIRLGLPAPDASAIEQLEGELVAFTIGGWKELQVTNLQANATNTTIDLESLVPGAKLVIKKIVSKSSQTTIEGTLEGPPEVQQLEVKAKTVEGRGYSSSYDRRVSTKDGKTIRSVYVQSFNYSGNESDAASKPAPLMIRLPQDPKRERVTFKLTALDLL